jgi:hypothetical protein
MYFSTKILSPVFQGDSKLVALFVMAVGIPFNFAPGFLPEVSLTCGSSAHPLMTGLHHEAYASQL